MPMLLVKSLRKHMRVRRFVDNLFLRGLRYNARLNSFAGSAGFTPELKRTRPDGSDQAKPIPEP